MYALLLVLGGAIAAAGLVLVASGVSIQDHALDVASITPGMIAVIGGCILIGLAFVIRALQRLERALRLMPRSARPSEAGGAESIAQPSEPARIPFPPKPAPKPRTVPQPQPAAVSAAVTAIPVQTADMTAETLPEKIPALDRLESAPMVVDSEVSLLPIGPARSEQGHGEVGQGLVPAHANGAAQARTAQSAAVNGRSARRPQQPKNSVFDSLWPKVQRPTADAAAAAAVQAAPTAPPMSSPQPANESQPSPELRAPAPKDAPTAPSVIKSGVVEGMAYTLYSDGSIEAQLPGGTLRFGSITELRNHIEQNG